MYPVYHSFIYMTKKYIKYGNNNNLSFCSMERTYWRAVNSCHYPSPSSILREILVILVFLFNPQESLFPSPSINRKSRVITGCIRGGGVRLFHKSSSPFPGKSDDEEEKKHYNRFRPSVSSSSPAGRRFPLTNYRKFHPSY